MSAKDNSLYSRKAAVASPHVLVLVMVAATSLLWLHADSGASHAQDPERRLTDPAASVRGWFGSSVAWVGPDVLVGAPRVDAGAEDAGAAYLFDGASGELLFAFANPDPSPDDRFGFSVASLDGNVLVGAPTTGDGPGATYLFDGASGALLQTFINPNEAVGDNFGHAVAAVGTRVLVGSHGDSSAGDRSGIAYLFDGDSGSLLHTFRNPDPAPGDWFGFSVAGVADDVLVGAPADDASGDGAGTAYLFDGNSGSLLYALANPEPAKSDFFGFSMTAAADKILISAPFDNTGAADAGAAYLFDGASGTLLHSFLNPAPTSSDFFGRSVAFVGENILVGAQGDDAGAQDAGVAYLFDGATRALARTFLNPEPAIYDWFGFSVAGSESEVLIGAQGEGAAYLFGEDAADFPSPESKEAAEGSLEGTPTEDPLTAVREMPSSDSNTALLVGIALAVAAVVFAVGAVFWWFKRFRTGHS